MNLPSEASTSQPRRQARIMEMVASEGTMRVDTIADELNVSLVTIYRDLAILEGQNLLNRSRGEVSAVTSSLSEMTSRLRAERNVEAKVAIAKKAAELVENGSSIMLDDSSTLVPFANEIMNILPLTVITNSQPILRQMESVTGMTLISTGGQYRRWGDSYHGSLTVSTIRSMYADLCIMSDAAIYDMTVCNPYEYVVETKRAMLAAAAKKVLLADSSKFGRRALHATAPLSDYDTVIVDSNLPEETRKQIRNAGVELIIAQV